MKAILIIITLAITVTLFATGKQYSHITIANDTDTVVIHDTQGSGNQL